MKNYIIKNKLLQILYKPYKCKINIGVAIKKLNEIEKELEKCRPKH